MEFYIHRAKIRIFFFLFSFFSRNIGGRGSDCNGEKTSIEKGINEKGLHPTYVVRI